LGSHRHKKIKHNKPSGHDQQPSDHGRDAPPPVYAVRIEPSPDDSNKYAAEQGYRQQQLRLAKILNSITAIGTVVGILGLLYLYAYLQATKKSANAAEQSARVAKDTLVTINRPWIGIEGIPTVRKNSEHWYIDFSVKNFGNSPALYAVPLSGLVTTAEEVNKALERYCTEGEKRTSSGEDNSGPLGEHGYVLFPDKIAQLQTPLQTAAMLGNQQNIASFVGCVTYVDQFGKRPVHHTSFCYSAKTPLVADKPMFACFEGWSAD